MTIKRLMTARLMPAGIGGIAPAFTSSPFWKIFHPPCTGRQRQRRSLRRSSAGSE
jgi:hypothetical protein